MMEQNQQTHQKGLYDRYYKLLLIIPVALLIFSLIYLYQFNQKNGDIINKDVSLTGGTTITVFDSKANIQDISASLKKDFPDLLVRGLSDIGGGGQRGFVIETKAEADKIKPEIERYLGYKLNSDNSSVEFSGSSLSSGFYQQLRFAIMLAFIFMAIVVFIIFRTIIPSCAVILSAFADIIMSIVVVNLLGISVSSAGIIAFLMLIGYSVDTDILLTSNLLKKKEGTINSRLYSAFKTGMMMTLTSIIAVAVSLFVIYPISETLRQIFLILLIGLIFDVLNTWFTNASILKWYMEVKKLQ